MPMAEGSYKLFSYLLVFEGKSRGGWGGRVDRDEDEAKERGSHLGNCL